MAEPDPLAEALGQGPADAVRRALAQRNQIITRDSTEWTASGYTGAVLAAVVVAYDQADHSRPVRCIAKVSPAATSRPESARHAAALRQSFRQEFVRRHLVDVPFDPVECPGGEIVSFQGIAGEGHLKRLRTLARLRGTDLADACRAIRAALLEDHTGAAYHAAQSTIPELLRLELRGRLDDWVVPPTFPRISTDEDGTLPNPLALALEVAPVTVAPQTYLTGRSHGDLHPDNVLVLTTPIETVEPGKFWLIDLSAFEDTAPLSRDPATLLVSILAHRVERLASAERNVLLEYILNPSQWPAGSPTDLVSVIEALREPGGAPFAQDGWGEAWEEQLRVSVLAAALLHTTYDSVGPEGQWWCLRLAARLAATLTTAQSEEEPLRVTPAVFGPDRPTERRASSRFHEPESLIQKQKIVNQKEIREDLRAAFLGTGPAVIVVHGTAGVGKSTLVAEAAAAVRNAGVQVFEHDAAGVVRPDAMTLIEDIEACAARDAPGRPDEAPPARLDTALDALDAPLAIIIDQAQVLLDRQAGTVADEEFDDALEVLSQAPTRRARAVLVTRDVPKSARSNTWPDNAWLIHVQGLREPHFSQYLLWLDPAGYAGLTGLEHTVRVMLRDRLQGNPMYATVANDIVSSLDGEYGAEALAAKIGKLSPGKVPQFLADQQRRQLPDKTKLVLAALAAFGTLVEAATVAAILQHRIAEENVAETLRKLAMRRLITVAGDHYCIPAGDPLQLLEAPPVNPEDWQDMLFNAAKQLGFKRKLPVDVHDVDDLDMYFAEIDVWRRARLYGPAYELIQRTDMLLRRWDLELRLLPRREAIRQLLDDPIHQMDNYNALGDLYASRRRFSDAAGAFKEALEIAVRVDDRQNQLRIETNMAAMHWEAGETEKSERRFRRALHAAELFGGATDRMSALEGLADCRRRWADYTSAIPLARQALSIAQSAGSDRAVNLALKLARWYAETNDLSGAERLIAAAEADAVEHADEALRTACVDGRADLLLLTEGREAEALEVAEAAFFAARRLRTPFIQLQAQTTRCMALLQRDDLDEAGRAVEKADRHRRRGRSLVVLALRALVAALAGYTGEADRHFEQLRAEAAGRHRRDLRDVGALQFLGYARSWPALTDDVALREAADYFRRARAQTRPSAPGVEVRLVYLVRRLAEGHRQSGRLQPILDAITGSL
ncbi:hypothetical protein ACGFMK_41040 [Amycolatopsis sp. NPDC049252]|uniref:hypothetical protein n=1 Tax=Amycolatopsis sp. NPDC049252 TaxID=3363933 RepID=UPI0037159013